MTESGALATAALWTYGIAAIAFAAFGLRLALGLGRSTRRGALLVFTVLTTAVWAGFGFLFALQPSFSVWTATVAADALRYGGWFLFLRHLLRGGDTEPRPWASPVAVVVAVGMVAWVALGTGLVSFERAGAPAATGTAYALPLALAVFGLMLVEQLYRNTEAESRWSIKPLVMALAALFAFDLYFYADAMLFGRLDPDVWVARSVANATTIPLLAVATARNTGWTVEMHVSRRAVFHSTAILLSGIFLLAVAGAGYLVRYFGGEWGRSLQVGFLFAALLVGGFVLSSGRFRAKLRVFVSKHFFSYRYDYRDEWLRFTATLSGQSSLRGMQEHAIKGLADLVESPGGWLWLLQDDGKFHPESRLNVPEASGAVDGDQPLLRFMAREGWIVDLFEQRRHPEAYRDLVLPGPFTVMRDAWLVVPLIAGSELAGFVVLGKPRTAIELNWEVRDLLKVASRQAASYLSQMKAAEALLEARKFEAFNRMSAFVVHDLKNLVAQLTLMLRNAERHRDNPAFQRDMLETVGHVADRMNQLMTQLRSGLAPAGKTVPVDIASLVRRVRAVKGRDADRVAIDAPETVTARGHEDRLEHIVSHLLQNALDATSGGGDVRMRVLEEPEWVVVEIADTGEGMTPEFVSERLFKPFQTTKATGMGIGVYESSQYLASIGGRLLVESAPGAGTVVRARLPRADRQVSEAAEIAA